MTARIEFASDAARAQIIEGNGPRRPVHGFTQQHVIAGSEQRQEHVRNGRQSRRQQHAALATFDFVDGILQGEGGRGAASAIHEEALALLAPRPTSLRVAMSR